MLRPPRARGCIGERAMKKQPCGAKVSSIVPFVLCCLVAYCSSSWDQSAWAQEQVALKQVASLGGFGTGRNQFQFPNNLNVDRNGNIYVADSGNHRIVKLNQSGETEMIIGSFGTGRAQ